MITGDEYRAKAAEAAVRARTVHSPFMRELFEDWERTYLKLADEADRNARGDVTQLHTASSRLGSLAQLLYTNFRSSSGKSSG